MSTTASSERFHTVVIRSDLPTIEKQYHTDEPVDLPQESYWIKQVIDYIAGDNWHKRVPSTQFKVHHMISNGPCESLDGCAGVGKFLAEWSNVIVFSEFEALLIFQKNDWQSYWEMIQIFLFAFKAVWPKNQVALSLNLSSMKNFTSLYGFSIYLDRFNSESSSGKSDKIEMNK